ncbi:MAG: Gfo/Idh/MocA family oxidoreductase [Oscillospiraceae bacterium]|nr:Gfo/Idh/MocA family oxidoreductase [Oscillospiraceae bacterium]
MEDITTPIGIGLIGYGGMGGYHVEQLMEHGVSCVQVIGIYDIKPERADLARSRGVFAYDSREAMLCDPRVELVVIVTPNDTHKEIMLDAIAHGKHVVCEKPVTMTLPDYEDMIAAADAAGLVFTVHQNRRWDPDFLIIKQILERNTLGPVFQIESRVHGSRGIPGDWRNREAQGGGMLLDWGIHLLDQMLQLMSDRRLLRIYAQLTNVTNEEVDDGFRALCQFEGGYSFLAEVLTSNFIELPRWYVLGENGSAVIRDWDQNGEIVMVSDWENRDAVPVQAGVGLTKTMAPRNEDTIRRYPLPEPPALCCWKEYYGSVARAIRGLGAPAVSYDEQRRLLKLIAAVFESGRKNQVVAFDDVI